MLEGQSRPAVLNPGPGEPQSVLAFVFTQEPGELMNQLKFITQLTAE